jgi:hypothetical protein
VSDESPTTKSVFDFDDNDWAAFRQRVKATMTPDELEHEEALWQAFLCIIGGREDADTASSGD